MGWFLEKTEYDGKSENFEKLALFSLFFFSFFFEIQTQVLILWGFKSWAVKIKRLQLEAEEMTEGMKMRR